MQSVQKDETMIPVYFLCNKQVSIVKNVTPVTAIAYLCELDFDDVIIVPAPGHCSMKSPVNET